MRRCAWSLVGLLISVRVAEDGTCESMPAPTAQPTTSAPSMTFAPTPMPPYEYAPTVDAMPYCRLQNPSVCWGNTHRFLAVTANGPFDGIDVGFSNMPALGDLDGDLDLVVGNYDGLLNYFENNGTSTVPVFVQRTGNANPFDGIDVGSYSAPALADIDGDGDLDLVVGGSGGSLIYAENTGTSTAPVFVARTGSANPFDGIDVVGQLQIVLVFIASLVLHAKDMPEQEGAPGNIFKGPLFAFVMVLIGTMTLLMTFYMIVAEYCGIESPKDAQEAAGSVAASLRRFARGRKHFSETKVPKATDDDDAAPEQIVVTPHGA